MPPQRRRFRDRGPEVNPQQYGRCASIRQPRRTAASDPTCDGPKTLPRDDGRGARHLVAKQGLMAAVSLAPVRVEHAHGGRCCVLSSDVSGVSCCLPDSSTREAFLAHQMPVRIEDSTTGPLEGDQNSRHADMALWRGCVPRQPHERPAVRPASEKSNTRPSASQPSRRPTLMRKSRRGPDVIARNAPGGPRRPVGRLRPGRPSFPPTGPLKAVSAACASGWRCVACQTRSKRL